MLQLKARGLNLSCVRTCVVVAEERPRISLCDAFTKLFAGLSLSPRAVSTSFGCRVNVAICLQGASSPDPTTVYVDLRALRNDRVTLTERGAPHSLPVMESGKLLPGVNVIIANPDTKGQCGDSHLGEVSDPQCSKIGKKVQFQKYKNTFFAISKMAKKSIFAPEKSFKLPKILFFLNPKIAFLVILNFFWCKN